MLKINTYSVKGVKKASTNLPKAMQEDVNMVLLSQAIRVYTDSRHPGLSKVKTRGEVALSTRKIYRQKGTGGARHGARSAPIFVGGGVAHGPKGMKRKLTLPKNMRQKALKVALSLKAKEGQFVVVDNISALKKVKDAKDMLEVIAKKEEFKPNSKFTIVLSDKNKVAYLAMRNLVNCTVVAFRNLNAYRVFYGGILILDQDALGEKRNLEARQTEFKQSEMELKKVTNKPQVAEKATKKSKRVKKEG